MYPTQALDLIQMINVSWSDQLHTAANERDKYSNIDLRGLDLFPTSTHNSEEKEKANGATSTVEKEGLANNPLRSSTGSLSRTTQPLPKPILQRESSLTPPRKILKVHADGKLSSPKPRASARPADGEAVSGEDNIVVIKYGKRKRSRILLGKKIDAILSTPPEDHMSGSRKFLGTQTTAGPPKPTHPFFIGVMGRDLDQEKTAVDSKPVETVAGRASAIQTSSANNKKMRVNSKPANHAVDSALNLGFGLPNFGSDHARVFRYPNAQEPIWPPAGMVRVEPLSEPFERMDPRKPVCHTHTSRKLKDAQIQIAPHEDVLRPLIELTNQSRAKPHTGQGSKFQHKHKYCRPQRHIMTGRRLQDMISLRLTHSLRGSSSDSSQETDNINRAQASYTPAPKCLQRVFEGIATTRSAFDRFECETREWAYKYAPQSAEDVLQQGQDAFLLRDWLKIMTVSSVSIQNNLFVKAPKHSKRRRKRTEELDGFVVPSDEETGQVDESTDLEAMQHNLISTTKTVIRGLDTDDTKHGQRALNAVLVSGPHGCGKSAAIYAVAHELGFEVFEINAGSRRSGKDILDRVGDTTSNHLVKHDTHAKAKHEEAQVHNIEQRGSTLEHKTELGREGTMKSFFQPNSENPSTKKRLKQTGGPKKVLPKKARAQRQSLILLEEVDVLFEEDRMFWATVLDLILNSRRPVIMTCTDESLVPLDEITLHGIFRIPACPEPLAIDYLLLVACSEGHLLQRNAVEALYRAKGFDLRASLSELNFFCQMAIGDSRGGLEWMLVDVPSHAREDQAQEPVRVVSGDTYCYCMGCFGGEPSSLQHHGPPQTEVDSLCCAHSKQNIDLDANNMDLSRAVAGSSREDVLRQLQSVDLVLEAYSAVDIIPASETREANTQLLDPTQASIAEKLRSHYTEGQCLLQADPIEDQSGVASALALTLGTCAQGLDAHDGVAFPHPAEQGIIGTVLQTTGKLSTHQTLDKAAMMAAFTPIAKASIPVLGITKGPQISCIDGPTSKLVEDIAPYIRSIVSYDLRLEEQRHQLSALQIQPGTERWKTRRTRASRAALEGGSKADTRRDRWFPCSTNFDLVLGTGGQGWQECMLAMTYVGEYAHNRGPVSQKSSMASSIEDGV
ncbi:MAG: hypothetical protein Q9163_003333 [Psora crenata]